MLAKLWLDGKLAKRSLSRYLFRRVTGPFSCWVPVAPKVAHISRRKRQPEFCQHNQACGRLAWAPPYTPHMVPHSLNHFWGHRNTAGKPTPPKKGLFCLERGVFRECSVPRFPLTRVFPLKPLTWLRKARKGLPYPLGL